MAIAFIFGTTAELIKLAPIIAALDDSGEPYELWNTAQHVTGLRSTCDDLGIRYPDEHFVPRQRQKQLVSSLQVPAWATQILAHGVRHYASLRRRLHQGSPPLVIVHGDTFTTLLGAIIGRLLGADVAHVEAGMRSGSILSPLPEEANRRLVARFATINYVPTANEVENLTREKAKGEIVNTGANTVIDSLQLVARDRSADIPLPAAYGLVTLHRFELLRSDEDFRAILETLAASAATFPLVMPAGATERARITALGLESLFGEHFQLVEKLPYARFIPVLMGASFVVTDSGGLQQECAALGKACCIHRECTEARDGLGENIILSHLDIPTLEQFLVSWQSRTRPSKLAEYHPTDTIMKHLCARGFVPDTTGTQ